MGLRLSTAMTLVMSLGVLAACGEDEAEVEVEESEAEVVVEEEVAEAEEVVEEEPAVEAEVEEAEGEVVVEEETPGAEATEEEVAEVEVEEEPEENVLAEAGGGEATELETTVESDGEPIVATAGAEAEAEGDAEAETADAEAVVVEEAETADVEVADAGTDTQPATETADEETQEQLAEDAAADEGGAEELEIVETEATEDAAETEETELAAADTGSADTGSADAGGDGEVITLDTDVTVVETGDDTTEQDVEQATGEPSAAEGGTDAEAQVAATAPEDAQVEETNDVATDGIDSGSEAAMIDLDNLVLDDAGVQRLTQFVESSEQINDSQKVTIVAGLDAARDNPERLEELLEQVRELTGQ